LVCQNPIAKNWFAKRIANFSTAKKQKAHRLFWRWACFLNFKCELGSSFPRQRHIGHLATTCTQAHLLGQHPHESKVNGGVKGVKKSYGQHESEKLMYRMNLFYPCTNGSKGVYVAKT
jgi:hypothetical protein